MDFLDQQNVLGQNLLKLVARGSAILSELQRMSNNIPKILYGTSYDSKRYAAILFDFEYFTKSNEYDNRVRQSQDLEELDQEFRESYMPLLERFYTLFLSIVNYYMDLNTLIVEINDGVFPQYSMENVLHILDGKKLFSEAFWEYGCMLLLLDNLIIGPVREKIVISYLRYKGSLEALPHINEVCKLCKNTYYLPPAHNKGEAKRPANYPEEFFGRFFVEESLISEIISTIKDDDMYKQIPAYPGYKSVALSNQAQIIYVLLYFSPKILHNDYGRMREIVDKHFYDNWVMTFYMGYTADLSDAWLPYSAAKKAIDNIIDLPVVQELTSKYLDQMEESTKQCQKYLDEGELTDNYVLENSNKLMKVLRVTNVTVRWLILHRTTQNKRLQELISAKLRQDDLLGLLLNCSQFESILKEIFQNLYDTKQQRWDADKKAGSEKMNLLAEYFSGKHPLAQVLPDESYSNWFGQMKQQIESLVYTDSTYTGRKLQSLIKALENVIEYTAIESNVSVNQLVSQTIGLLRHMVRTVNIKKGILYNLAQISDASYCWQCVKEYSSMMQHKIQSEPQSALLLKATFMKMASIMNSPMMRIIQANSPDDVTVSKYYSAELIKFAKNVLQIIPISVFDSLEQLITLLTDRLKPIPLKINKAELRQYQQIEERTEMAALTHKISVFAESILAMKQYLLGIIEVDPKQILEDGIRKELIKLICKMLDKQLVFGKNSIEDFEARLKKLAENFKGFKSALEYIQDFLNIYGLKFFYEEFNRLIHCYIEMESNAFLTQKQSFEELAYDEGQILFSILKIKDIPMPDPQNFVQGAINFMGRLMKEILNLTDARRVSWIDTMNGFYELSTGKEIFSLKTITLMHKCIGVSGLQGLDKLLGFKIVREMRQIKKLYQSELAQVDRGLIMQAYNEMKAITSFVDRYDKTVLNVRRILARLLSNLIQPVQRIGQFLLLRKLINCELHITAKVESSKLFHSIENLNQSLMNDIINRPYDQNALGSEENVENVNWKSHALLIGKAYAFYGTLGSLKENIYDKRKNRFSSIYSLYPHIKQCLTFKLNKICLKLSKLQYNKDLHILQKKVDNNIKNDFHLDGTCIAIGIQLLLNQFHPNNTEIYLGFLGQFIKNTIHFYLLPQKYTKETKELITDCITAVHFYEEVVKQAGLEKDASKYLDTSLITILEQYQ